MSASRGGVYTRWYLFSDPDSDSDPDFYNIRSQDYQKLRPLLEQSRIILKKGRRKACPCSFFLKRSLTENVENTGANNHSLNRRGRERGPLLMVLNILLGICICWET